MILFEHIDGNQFKLKENVGIDYEWMSTLSPEIFNSEDVKDIPDKKTFIEKFSNYPPDISKGLLQRGDSRDFLTGYFSLKKSQYYLAKAAKLIKTADANVLQRIGYASMYGGDREQKLNGLAKYFNLPTTSGTLLTINRLYNSTNPGDRGGKVGLIKTLKHQLIIANVDLPDEKYVPMAIGAMFDVYMDDVEKVEKQKQSENPSVENPPTES